MAKRKIAPFLWFDEKAGKVAKFYTSVFRRSKIIDLTILSDTPSCSIEVANIELFGQQLTLMGPGAPTKLNESTSLVVGCETQREIDYYWKRLSAAPEAEQCGWLKDKYGLSWQIVPTELSRMLSDKDQKKVARVTEAFLKMKKFDISALKKAYAGQNGR
ncbi:MAG TPA: VOC family protein [Terriglobales bacterium]|nr:VOC family protein [Terriglobales bacterium]